MPVTLALEPILFIGQLESVLPDDYHRAMSAVRACYPHEMRDADPGDEDATESSQAAAAGAWNRWAAWFDEAKEIELAEACRWVVRKGEGVRPVRTSYGTVSFADLPTSIKACWDRVVEDKSIKTLGGALAALAAARRAHREEGE